MITFKKFKNYSTLQKCKKYIILFVESKKKKKKCNNFLSYTTILTVKYKIIFELVVCKIQNRLSYFALYPYFDIDQ